MASSAGCAEPSSMNADRRTQLTSELLGRNSSLEVCLARVSMPMGAHLLIHAECS